MRHLRCKRIMSTLLLIVFCAGSILLNGVQPVFAGSSEPAASNIAVGAVASTTLKSGSGYSIKAINDGIDGSDWAAAPDNELPQYITLDFGYNVAMLNKLSFVVHFAKEQGITGFDVEYWSEGQWKVAKADVLLVWETTGWTYENKDVLLDAPIETTMLRLKIKDANRAWGNFTLDELKVWGYIKKLSVTADKKSAFAGIEENININIASENIQNGTEVRAELISEEGRQTLFPRVFSIGIIEQNAATLRLCIPAGIAVGKYRIRVSVDGIAEESSIFNIQEKYSISPYENIAMISEVTTDAVTGNGNIESIIDGNIDTPWATSTDTVLPDCIEFDFKGKVALTDKISVFSTFAQEQGITHFDVEYYLDGSWKTIVSDVRITWLTNGWTPESSDIAFPYPVEARKIRLVIKDANKKWGNYCITEIKIWGNLKGIDKVYINKTSSLKGIKDNVVIDVTTSNIGDGSLINSELINANGASIQPAVSVTGEVYANKSKMILSIPESVPCGIYKIKVSQGNIESSENEFRVLEPQIIDPYMNIAPIAAVETTAATGNGQISAIVDGKENTPWASATDVKLPQTITMDFNGRTAVLNKLSVVTWWAQGQAVNCLDVEYYDGTAWQSVRNDIALEWQTNDATLESKDILLAKAVEAKKIRINIKGANLAWGNFCINEIKVWGHVKEISSVNMDRNALYAGQETSIGINAETSNIADGSQFKAELVKASDHSAISDIETVTGTVYGGALKMSMNINKNILPDIYNIKISGNGIDKYSSNLYVLGNMAPKAKVTLGDSLEGQQITVINDCDNSTYWNSKVNEQMPVTLDMNFKSSRIAIKGVTLLCEDGNEAGRIDVQYFDGSMWRYLAENYIPQWTATPDNKKKADILFDSIASAYSIRICMNTAENSPPIFGLNEVKIWGNTENITVISAQDLYDETETNTLYRLPRTTQAVMSDSKKLSLEIKWEKESITLEKAGLYEYIGHIEGYSKNVKLALKVVEVPAGYKMVRLQEDKTGLVKNPAMGWVIYLDQFGKIKFPQDASEWWKSVDPYIAKASIVYLRIPWAQLEPEEGKYAWVHDQNFKDFVNMALQRGLKLSFRIFVDGKDANMQPTPDFVRESGCHGYTVNPGNNADNTYWTPYLYDTVFQEKFSKFVAAFAQEFNNPDIVDYIDAQGLGWWGEMHNVEYLTQEQRKQIFTWVTELYEKHFDKVLLGDQYGSNSFAYDLHEGKLNDGWIIRRDSFGSFVWLSQAEKDRINSHWPVNPVFAESCYQLNWDASWQSEGFKNVREIAMQTLNDAKECHANTLDLRNPADAKIWVEQLPDLVQDFVENGGYRLIPTGIQYPAVMKLRSKNEIIHEWKNAGVGKIPNGSRGWNNKYKIEFALLDKAGKPVHRVLTDSEPSSWIKGNVYSYSLDFDISGVYTGKYDLAVAVVDKEKNYEPAINLAVKNAKLPTGWYKLGEVYVEGVSKGNQGNGNSGSESSKNTSKEIEIQIADKKLAVTVDAENSFATLTLDDKTIENISAGVKHDESGKKVIEVAIPDLSVNKYCINIPVRWFDSGEDSEITIGTKFAEVTINDEMLGDTADKGHGMLTLIINNVDKEKLPYRVKNDIGNRPLVDLSIAVDDKKIEWDNANAPVIIAIPYVAAGEEIKKHEHIIAYYMDDRNNLIVVPGSRYDRVGEKVIFQTTHFSKYAVGYESKSFSDISRFKWAEKQIKVLASKGIIDTDKSVYKPETAITRGEFIAYLVRALGLTADVESNFDDVKTGDRYYKEIGIAKALGIAKGNGKNYFPDAVISRQDMMVLTDKTLDMLNKYKAAGTSDDLKKFCDAVQIASYARQSIANMTKEGIVQGGGKGINPLGYTSKASAAVLIYNIFNKYVC